MIVSATQQGAEGLAKIDRKGAINEERARRSANFMSQRERNLLRRRPLTSTRHFVCVTRTMERYRADRHEGKRRSHLRGSLSRVWQGLSHGPAACEACIEKTAKRALGGKAS